MYLPTAHALQTAHARFTGTRRVTALVARARMASARSYPPVPRGDVVDTIHGVAVADPYRWLEDEAAPETKAFVASQQACFGDYAAEEPFASLRPKLRAAHEARYNYARVGLPSLRGSHAFYFANTGLKNQDVLFKVPCSSQPTSYDALTGGAAPVPLLDLNDEALYPGGTTSLSTHSFNKAGTLMAYSLASGGSDWVTVRVRDVVTGIDLEDVIPWVKFSGLSWLADGSGFFYSRYPAPTDVTIAAATPGGAKDAGTETAANACAYVCFHKLGTAASADLLVYATPEQPAWRGGVDVTDCGNFITLSISKGTDPVNRLYVTRLSTFTAWAARTGPSPLGPSDAPPRQAAYRYLPFRRVCDNFDAEYDVIACMGTTLYLKSNLSAPRGRVLTYRLPAHDAAEWEDEQHIFGATAPDAVFCDIDFPSTPTPTSHLREVLREEEGGEVLDWAAHVAGDKLVTCVLKDVVNVLRVYTLPPADAAADTPLPPPSPIMLPGPGTIAAFSGRPELPRVFFKYVSFTTPGTSLSVDLSSSSSPLPTPTPFWSATLPGFDADAFTVSQSFVDASDGTRIPVFLVHRKDAVLPAPTLLYAYGGFGISMQPSFSPLRLAWLQNLGGVFALACIRGGGEYGKVKWHDAGARLNKRVCFNDFATVARTLAERKVTTPSQLAIMGGSNGGLLTLASSLREPGLFAAAVSQVPVADFVRFSKFTIGHAWQVRVVWCGVCAACGVAMVGAPLQTPLFPHTCPRSHTLLRESMASSTHPARMPSTSSRSRHTTRHLLRVWAQRVPTHSPPSSCAPLIMMTEVHVCGEEGRGAVHVTPPFSPSPRSRAAALVQGRCSAAGRMGHLAAADTPTAAARRVQGGSRCGQTDKQGAG